VRGWGGLLVLALWLVLAIALAYAVLVVAR
jgi:hypothetical protein